ncbi:MAG: FHA domain-containing protein, partial [Verrucomicrobiota bacterium]|nr:FHA domain-containing protein [Verrucomicrobiota bacterium]
MSQQDPVQPEQTPPANPPVADGGAPVSPMPLQPLGLLPASGRYTSSQGAPVQAQKEKHLAIHWLDQSGQEIRVNETGSPVIIGRSAGQGNESSTVENLEKADLCYLGVPAVVDIQNMQKISRVHAQVEYREDSLRLKDLNSSWGIYLNEARIDKEEEIKQEDQITLTDDDDGISFRVEIMDGPFSNSPEVLTPTASVSVQQPDPEAQTDTGSSKPEEHLVMDCGLDWDSVLQKCEMLISRSEEWDPTELLDRTEELLQKEGVMGLAFEQHRSDLNHQAFKVPELPPKEEADLWFIGDIHGDLLGMESSLAYIHHQAKVAGKTPWVIFL